MQGSVGTKTHFQQHLALKLQRARFVGINWIRFECDLDGRGLPPCICLRNLRSAVDHLFRSKSSGGNSGAVAAPISLAAIRNAVAEVCAGYCALDAFCAARPIALTGSDRHVKSSGRGGIQLRALLARAGQTIGIAKSSGLYFLHWSVNRGCLRTASEISRMHQLRARSAGN